MSDRQCAPTNYRPPTAVAHHRLPHIQRLLSNIVKNDLLAITFVLFNSLLLWTLAYQVPARLDLSVGGDSAMLRREDDAPFLRGFNASEPSAKGRFDWWNLDSGNSYRWATGTATVDIPGIGGGDWIVTLRASSGRPDGDSATSTWQAGTRTLPSLSIAAEPRIYHILADADVSGDLLLRMHTQPYEAPTDPRALGFVLHELHVAPVATSPRLPALAQLGWLAVTLVLVYTLARWLVLAVRPALILAVTCAALIAVLLATQRFALTLFTPALAGLALSCWALALLLHFGARMLDWQLPGTAAQSKVQQRQSRIVVALVLLAFAVRLGGMVHPHALFSDHRFNANNLLKLGLGHVYMQAGLPADAGGGQAPYPPGLYLLLAPMLLFAPPDIESRVLVVQSGVALLDSLVVALIWFSLRRAGLGQRAALFGAALYLLPPPILGSFSVGEYANIGGQALALPAMALLALSIGRALPQPGTSRSSDAASRSGTRGYEQIWIWLPLLCVGLLGHMGVTISVGLLIASAWGIGVLELVRPRQNHTRHCHYFALGALTSGGLLAVIIVGTLYYSAPQFATLFAQRLTGDSGGSGTTGAPLLPILFDVVSGTFAPYHRLTPPLVLSGLLGLAFLRQRCHAWNPAHGLHATLTAWWLGTLLAIGLPLITGASQGVRWAHFLYPALCLGAGPALATLWRRGTAGRLVVLIVLAIILSYGLITWIVQISDYMHR